MKSCQCIDLKSYNFAVTLNQTSFRMEKSISSVMMYKVHCHICNPKRYIWISMLTELRVTLSYMQLVFGYKMCKQEKERERDFIFQGSMQNKYRHLSPLGVNTHRLIILIVISTCMYMYSDFRGCCFNNLHVFHSTYTVKESS